MIFTLILPVIAFLSVPFSISSFFKPPASFRGESNLPPPPTRRGEIRGNQHSSFLWLGYKAGIRAGAGGWGRAERRSATDR